jgi:hypothetical protein
MSFKANRRRLLALASLALTAPATLARGQGSGDYNSRNPSRQQAAPLQPEPLPEGIPQNPYEDVIKDIGPWHIVSAGNQARAWIPAERLKVFSGGVETTTVGGGSMQAVADDIAIVDKNGKVVRPNAGRKTGQPDTRPKILIGGKGELTLQYWSTGQGYSGLLRISTTSNNQGAMPVTILVDDKPLRTLTVESFADVNASDLFGADLAGLAAANSLKATAEIGDKTYTIYEVALAGTADALKEMRFVPDYNRRVRGLGVEPPGAQNTPKPAQCFLTTACCELVGLDDNCFELTALRGFRGPRDDGGRGRSARRRALLRDRAGNPGRDAAPRRDGTPARPLFQLHPALCDPRDARFRTPDAPALRAHDAAARSPLCLKARNKNPLRSRETTAARF